jgi:hypothetical protein
MGFIKADIQFGTAWLEIVQRTDNPHASDWVDQVIQKLPVKNFFSILVLIQHLFYCFTSLLNFNT